MPNKYSTIYSDNVTEWMLMYVAKQMARADTLKANTRPLMLFMKRHVH